MITNIYGKQLSDLEKMRGEEKINQPALKIVLRMELGLKKY